jgi:hypothetical protein
MQLNEHEEKLLLRGLDKVSAPVEAQLAAEKLFESLRKRGVSGYDVLDQLEAGAEYMPYEYQGTPEWEQMRRTWDDLCRRDAAKKAQAKSTPGAREQPEPQSKPPPAGESNDFASAWKEQAGKTAPRSTPLQKKPVRPRDALMCWVCLLFGWLMARHIILGLFIGLLLCAGWLALSSLWDKSRVFPNRPVGSVAIALVIILPAILRQAPSATQPPQHLNTNAPLLPAAPQSMPAANPSLQYPHRAASEQQPESH